MTSGIFSFGKSDVFPLVGTIVIGFIAVLGLFRLFPRSAFVMAPFSQVWSSHLPVDLEKSEKEHNSVYKTAKTAISPATLWVTWSRAAEPTRCASSFHERSTSKRCTHENAHCLSWSGAFLKYLVTKNAVPFGSELTPTLSLSLHVSVYSLVNYRRYRFLLQTSRNINIALPQTEYFCIKAQVVEISHSPSWFRRRLCSPNEWTECLSRSGGDLLPGKLGNGVWWWLGLQQRPGGVPTDRLW